MSFAPPQPSERRFQLIRRAFFAAAMTAALLIQSAAGQSRETRPDLSWGTPGKIQKALGKLAYLSAGTETSVLTERKSYEWSGEDWDLIGHSLYSYAGNHRTEELRYEWMADGQGIIHPITHRETYARNGDLSRVEQLDWWDADAGAFIPNTRTSYFYVTNGATTALSRIEVDIWQDFGWIDAERTLYTLDENLQLTGGSSGLFSEGAIFAEGARFTISQEGNHVVQVDQEGDDFTGWEYTSRTTFENVTIAGLLQSFDALENAILDYESVTFGQRLLPSYSMDFWNGTEWIVDGRVFHEAFDPSTGDVARILVQWWDGEAWQTGEALTYEYEFPARPTSISLDLFSGEDSFNFQAETYEYDGAGNVAVITTALGLHPFQRRVFSWTQVATSADRDAVPGEYRLDAAYPNPFNPSTTITYHVGGTGRIALRLFDAMGRSVATLFDGVQSPGRHEIAFHAAGLASGSYLIRLDAPGFSQSRRVTLLK